MADNSSSVGERLAAIHLAMGKCCIAWKNLFRTQRPVTLTPDQTLEMADFFARTTFEIQDTAALLGFPLALRPEDVGMSPPTEPPPADLGKPRFAVPRFAVIEGGLSPTAKDNTDGS